MGLLQKAMETYDAMERLAGVYEEGKEPLAPIGHIVTRAQIEITLTADGTFAEAKAADKDQKIIIPVTEDSSSRSGKLIAPHSLCDKLQYLTKRNKDYWKVYVDQLEQWNSSVHSHPMLNAVLRYVKAGTIEDDLKKSGLITKKEDNLVVCWRVVGTGEIQTAVWMNTALMKAYSAYYLARKTDAKKVCMLAGDKTFITEKHLKGAFSLNGNAKIISANDSANFTYRGRFAEPEEAASVGYIASQKAHNALKWLISTQGTVQGGRAFVCWNPNGYQVPKPTLPFSVQSAQEPALPDYKSYREDLRKKIAGYQEHWLPGAQVILAAFDAATTGRLAITYYNEMLGSDFLERLACWDETCCWKDTYHGVQSPLLYNIIAFAFGTQRGEGGKVEPDEKLIAPQMQRLLSCRIDQSKFPLDIMQALVARAGNLQIYSKTNRNKLLCITCAAIRKYYIDHQKEELALALEPERKDRSYQWGRLLAVMEKIERDTYDSNEKRETNAIRMQSVFVKRPGYAFMVIMEQLKNAYYPRLPMGLRIKYERLIGEILEQIHASLESPEDYGKPLTESYLPGYYLQKSALYTKREHEETEEE